MLQTEYYSDRIQREKNIDPTLIAACCQRAIKTALCTRDGHLRVDPLLIGGF